MCEQLMWCLIGYWFFFAVWAPKLCQHQQGSFSTIRWTTSARLTSQTALVCLLHRTTSSGQVRLWPPCWYRLRTHIRGPQNQRPCKTDELFNNRLIRSHADVSMVIAGYWIIFCVHAHESALTQHIILKRETANVFNVSNNPFWQKQQSEDGGRSFRRNTNYHLGGSGKMRADTYVKHSFVHN